MEMIDTSLIDWSRAQFALTAIYHWLFVPLTLGMGVVMAIAETKYYRSGDNFWKETAKFWQKIFGINFAIGVATGLILEFQFGTNWSNYSWLVGDIFGAPLAIEGIFAFFMEATFIAVMFFGWDKVSKRFHLASTWLTIIGATLSAYWILVANAWMQYPVGMHFNPDTFRNEMLDFWAVALSPVAVFKFLHTVISSWILGAIVVVGISGWYLLRKRQQRFAIESIRIASWFGSLAVILTVITGHTSAVQVGTYQPMKLAAMENYYEGRTEAPLSAVGIVNPNKKAYNDNVDPFLFNIEIPYGLSILGTHTASGYVPGIKDIIEGYTSNTGEVIPSAAERIERGKMAITALAHYKEAKAKRDDAAAAEHRAVLEENFKHFGYGYFDSPSELIPHVPLLYYSFRVMVTLGFVFLLLFAFSLWMIRKNRLQHVKWYGYAAIISVPLVYLCSQAGWIVAELGRQPWAIQDILPVKAAVSKLSTTSVQVTFTLFLVLFSILLIAELGIMFKAIKQGPNLEDKQENK
ncbi:MULTISPECIES: cytochrome ubiquinol oxidase subunit I [Porphyromonas]|uniref:cytochrome ubiquinol oxidase subunit I n=1 Tax=Porphyromonas TaxID=836 RepID=UPI00051D0F77|nr:MULTISPECIES: cytochrome ubiquinol oxidase subunit I [Porphyromonas]KGL52925.1 cytochrome C oxidase subunit II [Porphyromonas canoris]KGN70387.1 cytochrome C oxidase subunit II [Porphyromonas sp. COT-108 OH1349]